MQNKPSIMDIFNSNKVTIEKAIDIVNGLSNEQILEVDEDGLSVLHMLAWNNIQNISSDPNLEQIVKAIVTKNPEILNLKSKVHFKNPVTCSIEKREGYTPIEFAIFQENLEYLNILILYYKDKEKIKILDWPKGIYVASDTVEEQLKGDVKSGEREALSPLYFALRHGQFTMFEFLCKNGFGELKLQTLARENLQELYKALFIAGNREELRGLHKYLGYYEGHKGSNSAELIAALNNDDKAKALELISQGHYVYDCSALDITIIDSPAKFIFCETLNHPNYNVATIDAHGWTPFHFAACIGNTEVAKSILEVVKDKPDLLQSLLLAQRSGDYIPLHIGAANGSTEIVKAILEIVKDKPDLLQSLLLAQSKQGFTPLHSAAAYLSTEVFNAILEVVKDKPELLQSLLLTQTKEGFTSLHFAASNGSIEIVKAILEVAKDKPDLLQSLLLALEEDGYTPLLEAAVTEETEVIKAILEVVKDKPELLQSLLLVRNIEGKDVLAYAANPEIRQLIEGHLEALSDQGRVLDAASSVTVATHQQLETSPSLPRFLGTASSVPVATHPQVEISPSLNAGNKRLGSESDNNPSQKKGKH